MILKKLCLNIFNEFQLDDINNIYVEPILKFFSCHRILKDVIYLRLFNNILPPTLVVRIHEPTLDDDDLAVMAPSRGFSRIRGIYNVVTVKRLSLFVG